MTGKREHVEGADCWCEPTVEYVPAKSRSRWRIGDVAWSASRDTEVAVVWVGICNALVKCACGSEFEVPLTDLTDADGYSRIRDNALGWQKRAYRAEAVLRTVRATAEYWRSDGACMPRVIKQAAANVLSVLDNPGRDLGEVFDPSPLLDEYREQ